MRDDKRSAARRHYCWYILAACFLLSFTTTAIVYNCSGLFIKPVSFALGYTRTQTSLFTTFINVGCLISAPFMGGLLQKKNQRVIILLCSIGAALTLVCYSFFSKMWMFYLTSFVLGLCVAGLTNASISAIISRWFIEKKALAMGIAFCGSGLGSAILNPVTDWFITNLGWQAAFRLLALTLLCINLPVTIFVIRNKPSDIGLLPYGIERSALSSEEYAASGLTRAQAIRCPAFWLLLLSVVISAIVGSGVLQHLSAYISDMGYSSAFAASIVSVTMIAAAVGKPLYGGLLDKANLKLGVAAIYLPAALGAFLLLFAQIPALLYVSAVLFGFGYCMISVPVSALTLTLFGPREYGQIFGLVIMCLNGGMALGSPLSAKLFDLNGSYRPAWLLYTLLTILAMFLSQCAIKSGGNAFDKRLPLFCAKPSSSDCAGARR